MQRTSISNKIAAVLIAFLAGTAANSADQLVTDQPTDKMVSDKVARDRAIARDMALEAAETGRGISRITDTPPPVTPIDVNQNNAGITLVNNLISQERFRDFLRVTVSAFQTTAPPNLPSFIREGHPERRSASPEYKIPGNAVIIDTGADEQLDSLIPIGYFSTSGNKPFSEVEGKLAQTATDSIPSGAASNPVVIRVSGSRSSLIVFNTDNQALSGDSVGGNESLIIGSAGTTFSTDRGVLTLHTGRLLIDSGKDAVKLATRLFGLKIEPHSTALIELLPGLPARVTSVTGGGAPVKLRVRDRSAEAIALKPGDALVFEGTGANLQTVSLQQIAQDEIVRRGIPAGLNSGATTSYKRLLSHLEDSLKVQPASDSTLHSLEALSAGRSERTRAGLVPLRILAQNGSEFIAESSGDIRLVYGSLFLNAPAGTLVKTDLGEAHMDSPAMLSVTLEPGKFRVQSCSGPDAVWVLQGHYKISLDPGLEVLLTDHEPFKGEVLVADGVGRREFTMHQLGNNINAVVDDFSIFSLLTNLDHLKPLRQPYSAIDKRAQNQLLTTAAAIAYSRHSAQNYYVQQKRTTFQPSGSSSITMNRK